jgi:hypothetical protein
MTIRRKVIPLSVRMGALLKLAGAATTARWLEIRDSEFLAIG